MIKLQEQSWTRLGWLFGVASPLISLVLDPGLFRTGGLSPGMLNSAALFSYGVIAMAMSALVHALVVGSSPPVLRGFLWAGALFASVIALIVVPFSLLFLAASAMEILDGNFEPAFAFGPAGLMALGTAVIYWRYFVAAGKPTKAASIVASLAGFAATLAVPAAANVYAYSIASRCMDRVLAAPVQASESDLRSLRTLAFTTDFGPFVIAYDSAGPGDQVALGKLYFELTGRDLARDWMSRD